MNDGGSLSCVVPFAAHTTVKHQQGRGGPLSRRPLTYKASPLAACIRRPLAFVTVSPTATQTPRITPSPARVSPITQTTARTPARVSPITQTTARTPARVSPTTALSPSWSRQARPATSALGPRSASIVRCPPVFPTVQLDKPPLRPQLGSIDFSPEELPCPCAMITLPWGNGCPICRLVTTVGLEAHPIAVIISRTVVEDTLTNPNVYILRYLAIATDPAMPVVDEWKAALSYFAAYNIVGYGFTEKPVQLLEHRASGVSVVYMRLDMGELPFPFHLIQAEFRSIKLRDFSHSEGSLAPAHVVALVDFRFGKAQNWNASCMRQVLYLICQLHVIVQSCLVYCRGTTFQVVVVPPNAFAQTVDDARRMHPPLPHTELSSTTTGSRVGTPNRGSRRICRPKADSGSIDCVVRAPAFPVARPGSWNTGVNFTPEPEWHDESRSPLTRSDLKEFEMLVEDMLPSTKYKFAAPAGRQMAVQSALRRGLIRHVPCCGIAGTATGSRNHGTSRVCVANNPDQRLLDKVDRLEQLVGTLVDKLTEQHEQKLTEEHERKRNAELTLRSEMLEEKIKALMSLDQLSAKSARPAIEETSETRDDRPADEFATAESPTSQFAVTAISDSGVLSDMRRCTSFQDCENPFRHLEDYCLRATLTDPKLNIPRLLWEEDLKRYFSQFGDVLDVRIPRGRRTHGHTGIAFVMFRYTDVARIVKDTMHNYILEDNRLSCSIIQHETLPPNLFRKPQLKNLQKEYADKYAMFKADCRFSSAETRDKFWQLQGKKAEKCAAVGIDVVEGRF